jgi:hypothetical protein
MAYFFLADQRLNGPVRRAPPQGSFCRDRFLVRTGARLARTWLAGWLGFGDFIRFIIGSANCGWQHGEIETRIRAFVVPLLRAVVALESVIPVAAVAVVVAFAAIIPGFAIITLTPVVPLGAAFFATIAIVIADFGLDALIFAGFNLAVIVAPVAAFTIVAAPFALRPAFFLAAAVVGEHAEIMVGKLVVIFGLHTVAVQLCILRQLFIFFEHLRRIAARTIIDAILVIITIAIVVLGAIIAPAATAAGLPVIHKDYSVLIFNNPVS